MTLNDRISKVCQDKKVKQNDLVKLGLGSKQTINLILHGKQSPNSRFLEAFLTLYKDVNARWLLTGEDAESIVEDPRAEYGYCKECLKKEGVIEHLKKENQVKEKRIIELEIKLASRGADSQGDNSKKAS
jgi:transcriptional regulator with XRE-family HTH domain